MYGSAQEDTKSPSTSESAGYPAQPKEMGRGSTDPRREASQALSPAAAGAVAKEDSPADQPEAAEPSEPAKEEPESKAEVAVYSLRDERALLAYCRDAKVRLVRADFLRELLAEGRTMPRRQEAEGMRTKDGRPALLMQEELEAKLPGGQVDKTHHFSVMALSHSWESREIPDVARFQLRVLVEALDTFAEILQKIAPAHKLAKGWEAAIFVDYICLYQFPRTEEQDVYFAKGMANMHLLYAHDETWSLRIEDLTPGLHDRSGPELSGTAKVFYLPDNAVTDVALAELRDTDDQGSCGPGCHFGCSPPCRQLHRNSTPYRERGWCMAEIQWSLARKASWKSIRIPFREGRNAEAPMTPSEFRAQAETGTLKFTHRSDLEPVLQLQAKVFREKALEATGLVLAHLPEAQVQVLARALPHYEQLEVVTVGNSELAGEAFQALVRALPWSRLRNLKLLDSGFGDAEAEALGAGLGGYSSLRVLWLFDNRIGDSGLQAIAEGLTDHKGLRDLDLSNNGFGDVGAQALGAALKALPHIEELRLQQNAVGDSGAQALGAGLGGYSSLRVLWLFDNRIGDSGLQAIAEGLTDHKGLRKLNLSKNGFGDVGAQVLGAALKALPHIEELMLGENALGDSGAQALAAGLGGLAALEKLFLYGNRLGDGGIKALASALQPHSKLEDLRLQRNSITDVGLQALVEVLQHLPQMQILTLGCNSFSDDGTQALAGVLPRLLKLTTLTLSQNRVSDAGAEALVHGLRDNRVLNTLWLHENSLSDAGVEAVDAAFRDRTMEDLKLRPQR